MEFQKLSRWKQVSVLTPGYVRKIFIITSCFKGHTHSHRQIRRTWYFYSQDYVHAASNSTVRKHTQWMWEAGLFFSESFVHRNVDVSIFPGSKSTPFCCLCSQPRRWSSQDCITAGTSHTVTRSFPGCCALPFETGLLLDPILSPSSHSKLSLFTILNSTLFQIFFWPTKDAIILLLSLYIIYINYNGEKGDSIFTLVLVLISSAVTNSSDESKEENLFGSLLWDTSILEARSRWQEPGQLVPLRPHSRTERNELVLGC